MATPNAKPTKVVTGEVRLAYANLLTPRAPQPGADPKYSCVLLPKNFSTVAFFKSGRSIPRPESQADICCTLPGFCSPVS